MITVKTFATLGEAATALSADRDACFLGGGTLVMRAVNEGDAAVATIVRSTDRGFTQVRPAGARIEIGAGVTMAQILRHDELAFLHPAARAVGGPAIRSMATVGGNLFAPSPYGDFTTALLALDADGVGAGRLWRSRDAARGVPCGPRTRTARAGRGVSLARPAGPDVFRFRKVARVRPKGIAVLTIAAVLPLAGGRVAGARIAYGAMGPMPMRARAVERALEGRTLDPAGIAAAVAAAAEGTSPASDAIASDWYRREILPVHLAAPAARQRGLNGGRDEQDRRPVPPQRQRRRGLRRRRRQSAHRVARRHRRHRAEIRVRAGHLRGLHRAHRRRAASELPDLGRDLPGPRRSRPPTASRTGRSCIRCRSRSWSISPPSAVSARRAC